MADATGEPVLNAPSLSAQLLARLCLVEQDLQAAASEDGVKWRREALKTELWELVEKAQRGLAPDARPIHRAQLAQLYKHLKPAGGLQLGQGVGRNVSVLSQPPVQPPPLSSFAGELRTVLERADFAAPLALPAAEPRQPAAGRRMVALFRMAFRRIERNRLRATLRELRRARRDLALRDLRDFRPDELKLISALTDRLTKSWPFRAAFVAAVAAAGFAVLGTITIGNANRNFIKEVEERTETIDNRTSRFNTEADDKAAKLAADYKELNNKSDEIKAAIIHQVVEKMTDDLTKQTGQLTAKLEADATMEAAVRASLATLADDVGRRQRALQAIDSLETVQARITAEETRARAAADQAGQQLQAATTSAGQVAALAEQVKQAAARVGDQDRAAETFRIRLASLEPDLKVWEERVKRPGHPDTPPPTPAPGGRVGELPDDAVSRIERTEAAAQTARDKAIRAAGEAAAFASQASDAAGRIDAQDRAAAVFGATLARLQPGLVEWEDRLKRPVPPGPVPVDPGAIAKAEEAKAGAIHAREQAEAAAAAARQDAVMAEQARQRAESAAAQPADRRAGEEAAAAARQDAVLADQARQRAEAAAAQPADRRVAESVARLDVLEPHVVEVGSRIERVDWSVQILQASNIAYLPDPDCRRVQQVLVDVGAFQLPPPVKGKKLASPVDGQCGAKTSAALQSWQTRERRPIAPARTAEEIVHILRTPRAD